MQGRLLPPIDGRIQAFPAADWRAEFARAAEAGLAAIEWIYEQPACEVNPIATDQGLEELAALSARHGVAVRSVCADYFMDQTLVRAGGALPSRAAHLAWLIARCRVAGIERVVLPFVDASDVKTASEEDALVDTLREAERLATAAGVELHLEMSFGPARFANFMERLPDTIRVNYDSGNSAALGYHPREEFAAYGGRIGSVHVKDRLRGGTTVPLGQGNADLPAFFAALRTVGYNRDIILQVARGDAGREIEWARQNLAYVQAALA
ncbi:MAG: sugar phosphate isomerase/epimerase [Acidobacteriota bacterium]